MASDVCVSVGCVCFSVMGIFDFVELKSTKVCNDMLIGLGPLLRSCACVRFRRVKVNESVQRHADRIGSPTEIMCMREISSS